VPTTTMILQSIAGYVYVYNSTRVLYIYMYILGIYINNYPLKCIPIHLARDGGLLQQSAVVRVII